MLIREIEGATRRLGAPADWDQSKSACDTLPIVDVETDNGPFMVSAWQPTAEELAALNAGAPIRLWIQGTNHPVVALAVDAPDEQRDDRADAPLSRIPHLVARDEQAVSAALLEMCDAMVTWRSEAQKYREITSHDQSEFSDGYEAGIAAILTARAEIPQTGVTLTDEQITEVWEGMPGGREGFRKQWGYWQFARALLARAGGKA
ncbi:hypothetical protein [Burkholderia ubonensis]|uniref:hypothetical protein n=1 Tax=Burkholderia ubonensis TaxID=101571 RepID=UPI0007C8216C|nr:hypothetical protein [Burkholderia ubonensis]